MFISLFSCFLMLSDALYNFFALFHNAVRLRVRRLSVFSLAVSLAVIFNASNNLTGISVGNECMFWAKYCTCRSVLHHHLSLFSFCNSFLLQNWLSHFSFAIAVHVSSSDTLEHNRKQAHAVYPSELSIFKTGCWLSMFFLSFFLVCSLLVAFCKLSWYF